MSIYYVSGDVLTFDYRAVKKKKMISINLYCIKGRYYREINNILGGDKSYKKKERKGLKSNDEGIEASVR